MRRFAAVAEFFVGKASSMSSAAAALFLLLLVKHVLVDGPLQTTWMVKTKGRYGHPGGLVHAGLHALGSVAVVLGWAAATGHSLLLGLVACLAEGLAHYHIDWAKMRLERAPAMARITGMPRLATVSVDPEGRAGLLILSPWWYYTFIFDQALHVATYVAMVWALAPVG